LSSVFIHTTAEVSDKAKIGDGTKIWNQVQVRENATLGENCIISKNVYIDAGVVIGNRVKVQNNVSVYVGVTIEDDVFVGPAVTFTNDYRPRASNASWQVTPTLVRNGASLGANATLVCGITIGEFAMVAAGSVVTADVAPHVLVAGNPARPIGYVYRCGARVRPENFSSVAANGDLVFVNPESGEALSLHAATVRIGAKPR